MKSPKYFDLFLHTLFYSLITVAAAQFYINIFSPEFSVSLGIVFLASFAMLAPDFPVLPVSALSGVLVLFSRAFLGSFRESSFNISFSLAVPELFFYLFYGVLLTVYIVKIRKSSVLMDTAALLFCDYAANFGELMLRLNINAFSNSSQSGILITALLRTVLIFIFITIFRQYHLVLIRREQKDYYQNLALLTSRLQEEVIWMKKNSGMVESAMHLAYQLFERLRADSGTKDAAKDALVVANNIHEIKKEYYLILRGLSDVLSLESTSKSLPFSDLFSILEDPIRQFAASHKKTVSFHVHGNTSLCVPDPYCLLSVFRNLFMNAIEASEKDHVRLDISIEETGESLLCTVTDDGPGISPDILPMIFDAGFSTKINYETGEISRGLGLNIVKNIIVEQLGGTITATSRPGKTSFHITFKKTTLEESK